MGRVGRILKPIVVGLRHLFMKPITVKYPFTRLENIPEESYRYDRNLGAALPGYKGRHLLHLDRCTGCGSCDRACQEVAEAITPVYAFDVELEFGEEFKRSFEKGGAAADAALILAKPFGATDLRIKHKNEKYLLRLNEEPIWEHSCEAVYEGLLMDGLEELMRAGWRVEEVAEKPRGVEMTRYVLSGEGLEARLIIRQRDMGYKQNKRSVFPAVDYGRCVFCGLCVDACPFGALEMIKDFELSVLAREELFYDPLTLSSPPFTTHPPESTWAEKLVLVLRRYR